MQARGPPLVPEASFRRYCVPLEEDAGKRSAGAKRSVELLTNSQKTGRSLVTGQKTQCPVRTAA